MVLMRALEFAHQGAVALVIGDQDLIPVGVLHNGGIVGAGVLLRAGGFAAKGPESSIGKMQNARVCIVLEIDALAGTPNVASVVRTEPVLRTGGIGERVVIDGVIVGPIRSDGAGEQLPAISVAHIAAKVPDAAPVLPPVLRVVSESEAIGSSLSETQEELLARHFKNACLMMDGDEAGKRAMDELLLRLGKRMWVWATVLPDGKQPDQLSDEKLKSRLGK